MAGPLDRELAELPAEMREELSRFHFDAATFLRLAARVPLADSADNTVKGVLAPPRPADLAKLPAAGSAERRELEALGQAELAAGRVALAVLAGGMATRMGGVVKALVEAVPGKTFLQLRLDEMEAAGRRYGKTPPLWLMASQATQAPLEEALAGQLDPERVAVFSQFTSLRLTPAGELYRDAQGRPSEHAPGHGDFPAALQRSGLVQRFCERGGRIVMLTNLDNLGATLDEAIIGWHVRHGAPVTCEVVDKLDTDRGGIPVYVDGRLAVLEEFRIPASFDPSSVRVFATNVFHFDARTLAELDMPWTYFVVNKKVGGDTVIQFERLVNEVTSHLETRYLQVPRIGTEARFLPVKDGDELSARQGEILAVARARGILS